MGFTYNTISESSPPDSKHRLKWLRLQPEQEFALQPYEHLAGVLRTNGHEDAAIEIFNWKTTRPITLWRFQGMGAVLESFPWKNYCLWLSTATCLVVFISSRDFRYVLVRSWLRSGANFTRF
jgi:hypothetical protein